MKIAITGGAGYVGSMLVPHLLRQGHWVTVLDTFWYGDHLDTHVQLRKIKGDIRNRLDLKEAFKGKDAVIHLACVSNDPSFDMNPGLGKDINYSCFLDIIRTVDHEKVEKFIYASSSSIYGVSEDKDVKEDSVKKPLTDYSKYKLACENQLRSYGTGGDWTIIRPATVCGYSKRMRLDLVVNILTMHALAKKKITLFGQDQLRPNINIHDMVAAYDFVLSANPKRVRAQTFNVGFENLSLLEIGQLVKDTIGDSKVQISLEPTNDPRSYHINSDKILEAGFVSRHTIREAIMSIQKQFATFHSPLENSEYNNIKRMKELGL